jgi:rhodanese-related sulfurtransferase/glutaredoxin
MKGIALFVLQASLLLSCTAQQGSQELDPNSFEKGIASENIQLLDVRTAGEFKSGYIKKSQQADWNDKKQFTDRVQYIDKNKPVYVYCLSGARSASAADWLRKQGYLEVYHLKGGMISWKANNKPVEGAIATKQMTAEEYQSSINSSATVLVDFGADWCPPCKKMEPVLEALQKEHGANYKLVKVDGGKDVEIMKANKVDALPVFIIYKNGKEVWRGQGIVSKEELIKNL